MLTPVQYLPLDRLCQHQVISPEQIPFSASVVQACQANVCGRYGSTWTCPPGAGDPKELERRIKNYQKAVVFTCKYDLEDCFDFEGMTDGARQTADLLVNVAQQLQQDGVSFMALGCEGCRLCEKCTYPNAPCRFPQKAFPSVEACGINVVELARSVGLRYNNGPETVTYFCIILWTEE